jgi:predicted DNA-binding transcriptional regulator AlpA
MPRADRRSRWHSPRGKRSGRALASPRVAGRPNDRAALAEADAPTEPDAPTTPTEPDAPTEGVLEGVVRDDQTNEEPTSTALSLTEAALATGIHRATLRRYLEAERFPNSYRDAGGAWQIPISDVLSAGLLLHTARAEQDGPLSGLESALERLRAENAELRRRLNVAEALANERAAQIADLRLSLRMLPTANPARTVEARESSPFVWSGEITQVGPGRP